MLVEQLRPSAASAGAVPAGHTHTARWSLPTVQIAPVLTSHPPLSTAHGSTNPTMPRREKHDRVIAADAAQKHVGAATTRVCTKLTC